MKTSGMKAGAVAMLMALLALTACGGSKKASTSTAVPSTTAPKPDRVDDAARARSLVLVSGDFPAGWTASAPEPDDPEDDATDEKLAECIGVDTAEPSAEFDGQDFAMGGAEVSTSVALMASRADFEEEVEALQRPKFVTCTEQVLVPDLEKQLQEDSPGTAVTDAKIERFDTPTYGEVTVGLRFTLAVDADGRAFKFYIDFVVYGEGRVEAILTFFSVGAPFDPALQRSLLAKAGAKLETTSV
jgi:hypothetical protein